MVSMRYSLHFGFHSHVFNIFSVRYSFIFLSLSIAVLVALLLEYYVVVTGIIAQKADVNASLKRDLR